jgi:hypothetical protein
VIGNPVKQCKRQPGATSCTEVQCQTASCPLPPGCDRPGNCIGQGTCQFTPTPGASCSDGNQCTSNDVCSGSGTCIPGTPIEGCQPCSSAAQCDDGNPCTTDTCPAGTCQHGPAAGVVCRPAAGECDVAETCTAASAECPPDAFLPSSTVCRESVGACDVAETCTGSTPSCPADVPQDGCVPCTFTDQCDDGNVCTVDTCEAGFCRFRAGNAGATCRDAAGPCDVPETCTGASTACPADVLQSATAVCRPSAGSCDVAETCTGSDPTCPPDRFAAAGTVCRRAAGDCDVGETCAGDSPVCPTDALAPATTVCRPAAGPCDRPETCDGTGIACPPDTQRSDGDSCDDDDPVTATSTCQDHECRGVALSIMIPPVIDVPAARPANRVKVPLEIASLDGAGTQSARVTAQAFVSCLDLPLASRPVQCSRTAETLGRGLVPRLESVFLPVTRSRKRNLGRRRTSAARINLPLTKLGRKLFARLRGDEQLRQLPLQVTAALRDRQGRRITAAFQSLLERRR